MQPIIVSTPTDFKLHTAKLEATKYWFVDMDGTLLDTESYHFKSIVKVFDHFGRAKAPSAEQIIGMTDEDIFNHYLGDSESVDWKKLKMRFLSEQVEASSPDDFYRSDLLEFFEYWHKKGKTLTLVTASTRAEVELIFKRTPFAKIFQHTISNDDVYPSKPSPSPYLAAMRALRAFNKQCLVIEDSPTGLQSATSIVSLVYHAQWYAH